MPTHTPQTADENGNFPRRRHEMVANTIVGRGVYDAAVVRAMRTVRRERFVPDDLAEFAYQDSPLPIGSGQTISQPYIVALMAAAAEIHPTDRVLEIGTGSGYSAAVLASVAHEVVTIERLPTLAARAREQLADEGFEKVTVAEGDGTLGWPAAAPYDAIIVTAGGPRVPAALREQLAEGGRMIIPIGEEAGDQHLLRVRRYGDSFVEDDLGAVRFVPLIGDQGWQPVDPDVVDLSDLFTNRG